MGNSGRHLGSASLPLGPGDREDEQPIGIRRFDDALDLGPEVLEAVEVVADRLSNRSMAAVRPRLGRPRRRQPYDLFVDEAVEQSVEASALSPGRVGTPQELDVRLVDLR